MLSRRTFFNLSHLTIESFGRILDLTLFTLHLQHCFIIKVSRAGSWRDTEWNYENDGSGVYSTLLCQRNETTATVLYLLSSRLNRDKSLRMVGALPWSPQSSICYVKPYLPLNPLSPYLVSTALLLAAATLHIAWHRGDLCCRREETKIAENRETESHKEEQHWNMPWINEHRRY